MTQAAPITISAIGDDQDLYPIEKLEAHRRGVLHWAISVFLFDGDALLIQRRALSKYHCGGQWANTCCSHPNWGEDLEACAVRRLREELGVDAPALSRGAVFQYRADVGAGLWEHERVQVYWAQVARDRLPMALNPEEVAETRWIDRAALDRWASETPGTLTPWFRIYLAQWSALDLPV